MDDSFRHFTINNNHDDNENNSKEIQFPAEILLKILTFQFYQLLLNNTSSNSFNIQYFIKSNLTVNKVFYRCVIKIIYKYCSFKTPHTFDIFLNSLLKNPKLGEYVQVLDFQEFTSIGLGRTGKMNKEIQMVTSTTILNCLLKTPNLIEFLASENIKDDLNSDLLYHLFNNMKYLKSIDFCGCSGEMFVSNFDQLIIKKPANYNITDLSLHDCTDLTPSILEKLIVNLPNLKKLDLTHTQITSTILNLIPHTAKLTHLSLSYCIQLTTRELINFFINHPAITCNKLVWLNLQCDSSTSSPLNNNQLTFLLKILDCDFVYLNLGGLDVSFENLMLIKRKFVNLKSLSIANNSIEIEQLIEFLKPPEDEKTINSNFYQRLEFLDLSNNRFMNRWSLDNPQFLNCCPSLIAFEFSIKTINDIDSMGGKFITRNENHEEIIWKTYDSLGRRGWLFKVDQERNPDNLSQIGLVEYDINTGRKLFKILKQPDFLKNVNKKISVSKGILFNAHEVFGDFERGIYKYYGMKM
ncbi:F-box protein [Wickerhamomyces ciferrii]|uniref:F-box protein n=1 Tax=Wickerhamomyces ciferrii (strain ATCC 14091 / BCRC 22168 / CBS 111 / JCM 3599 / NBRC 0793 / NRRL Y-1031 F-60-10) TaxID=1206466 RepID=K0KKH1_WICCF|nr:F-box protein [Wickerhamomyces ciferrii]CCH43466.1 F-box protein [Wickerhamomyces ciferrii]